MGTEFIVWSFLILAIFASALILSSLLISIFILVHLNNRYGNISFPVIRFLILISHFLINFILNFRLTNVQGHTIKKNSHMIADAFECGPLEWPCYQQQVRLC